MLTNCHPDALVGIKNLKQLKYLEKLSSNS